MSNTYILRHRIESVQSVTRIVSAIQTVAMARMRQAQKAGLAGRPYTDKIEELMRDFANHPEFISFTRPLMQQRMDIRKGREKKITIIHISADRGFTGGLLSNINRLTMQFVHDNKASISVVAVGRKGGDYLKRNEVDVQKVFSGLGDKPDLVDTLPISHSVIDDYMKVNTDEIYIAYTKFISTDKQMPVLEQVFPVLPGNPSEARRINFEFEPGMLSVLTRLVYRYIESKVYHCVLEAVASEQSARTVAMQNAKDNALELVDELTLSYYKERQEHITEELIDIAAGTAVAHRR